MGKRGPCLIIKKNRERGVELGQISLALIYGSLQESASGIMKDLVVPHEDRAFSRHLEVGTFPSNIVFSYVLGPFMRADEELGRSG